MDKQKYLAPFFGGDEEKAAAFLEKTGLKQKALQEAGIESKEKAEEPKAEETAKEPAAVETPAQPDTKAILEALKKELGMEELSETVAQLMEAAEKVPMLEALVKEMQGNQDEKLAEILTPPASRYAWMNKARATESEENVAKEDEEKTLKQKAPGVPDGYWLSEITGTAPVQAQQ